MLREGKMRFLMPFLPFFDAIQENSFDGVELVIQPLLIVKFKNATRCIFNPLKTDAGRFSKVLLPSSNKGCCLLK